MLSLLYPHGKGDFSWLCADSPDGWHWCVDGGINGFDDGPCIHCGALTWGAHDSFGLDH